MVGVLEAVVPSIAVGLIFWLAMRFVVRADRNERNAIAALEAREDEERARREAGRSAADSHDGAEPAQNV
jgi:hypothetical protein